MPRYFLAGVMGDTPLRFELGADQQSVGRTPDNGIHIGDPAISRKHAVLHVESDVVHLKDLESLNGTFVNGKPLKGATTLATGDKIRFGHVTLTLVEHEATPYTRLSDEASTGVTLTTTIQEIRSQARRSRSDRILAALAETGQMLSKRMDLNELYEQVLDLLDRTLTASRIMLLEGTGSGGQHKILASRVNRDAPDEPLRMSTTMLREIMENGRSFLTSDAAHDAQWDTKGSIVSLGVHAAMGAPLFDNDRILGAMYVDSRNTGMTYAAEDLQLLTLLANMVAVKITNSRLEEEERTLEQIRRELALAGRIQTNLLPTSIPEVEGYEIFAHQDPCEDIGGDLYDVHRLPDGRTWLILGDVTGHGVGAALLMANCMAGLQILEDQVEDPVVLVSHLERHLERNVEIGQYVTMFAGLLDPATGKLLYVNAGHQPPIVLGSGDNVLLPSCGLPVAILPGNQERVVRECVLEPGQTLLVFSDGVSEFTQAGVQYDEGRMQEFLASNREHDASTFGNRLLEDVETFGGGQPAADDLTLLVVRRIQ